MNEVQHFWQINIGNVLAILTALFAFGGFWWRTAQQEQKRIDEVAALSKRLTRQESEVDTMTKMGLLTLVNQHERRLSDVERTLGSLMGIQTDIGWIKHELERNSSRNKTV